MKKILILGAVVIGLAAVDIAGTPAYKSFSGVGSATTPTSVIIPADPNLGIRVVSINYLGDTNNAALTFSKGGAAYYSFGTNSLQSLGTTTAVTNSINTTNGLVGSSVMVLQTSSGAVYQNTLSSWGGTTGAYFIVLASGGFGAVATTNSDIFQMQTATSPYSVGNATNWLNGDAIYTADQGRPLIIKLSPALSTNQIISASVRYE